MWKGNSRKYNPDGFTAIEMLAVLLLMAITAAGATLSLARLAHRADLSAQIEKIHYFDQITRQRAVRQGVSLMLKLDPHAIARDEGDGNTSILALPDGYDFRRVWISAQDQTTVTISAEGLSPSYALLIAGPRQRQWMIVSALGEVRTAADDGSAELDLERLRHE